MAAQHSFPADRKTLQASPWLAGWDHGPIFGTPRGHIPLRHHWVYAIGPKSGHLLAGLSAFTGSAPAGIHLGSAVLACGLPATAAPIDRSATGLPIGVQIIGPYTTLAFAELLEREFGGFVPPP
jgi:hypothetical protein